MQPSLPSMPGYFLPRLNEHIWLNIFLQGGNLFNFLKHSFVRFSHCSALNYQVKVQVARSMQVNFPSTKRLFSKQQHR